MTLTAKVETVSPALAEQWLLANENNRPVSKSKIAQFASDMRNGRWVLNGEPLIFADDGKLNDGQHRLYACIEAGLNFQTMVIEGAARASRTTVDQGRNRGAADYLQMEGEAYAKGRATVGRLILAYERSRGQHLGAKSSVTNAEILERVSGDEWLLSCIRETHGGHVAKRSPMRGTMGAFLRYITPSRDLRFFEQVAHGERIERGDPAFAVRDRLNDLGRCSISQKVETYLRGLRAFQDRRKLSRIQLTGTFPMIGPA